MTCVMCEFPWGLEEVMRRFQGDFNKIKENICGDHRTELSKQATKINT